MYVVMVISPVKELIGILGAVGAERCSYRTYHVSTVSGGDGWQSASSDCQTHRSKVAQGFYTFLVHSSDTYERKFLFFIFKKFYFKIAPIHIYKTYKIQYALVGGVVVEINEI